MKKAILFIVFTSIYFTLMAQPSGYTSGTQVCWTFNGRDHGYFKAAGTGERHILIAFTGDGETNCSTYQNLAPQKWLNDNGTNWNGRTVRAAGDTVVWEVFTIPNTSGYWVGAYAADIDTFFNHIAAIDTSDHSKFHIMGLSGGVARFWGYLMNDQSHNSPYRNIFSTTISEAGTWFSTMGQVHNYKGGKRHWVWYGTADGNPGTPPAASVALYDTLSETRHLTAQSGTGHDSNTWDSCMSLAGTDTLTSRWLWMAKRTDTAVVCPDAGGGPSGYTPGTQVCWNFNGRDHGYFRAAGCGQRHILIAFTGDNETDCNDYQTNSPQKILEDAGINWNGKTVRAAGDTVLWEVLTIPNTSSYWLSPYAADIDSFFKHIAAIDTSDHRRFHAIGLGGGVARMWGYLVNDQSHNSPYRNIFNTTISMSSGWLSPSSQIAAYSTGRRHWVWHGASDANSATPPSAGQSLYDLLNGSKRLTMQTGGTHSANTWDSCMSISGTDSSTNRWLWMALDPGGSPYRLAGGVKDIPTGNYILPGKVSLYPNPARNKVMVILGDMQNSPYSISIRDLSGRRYKTAANIRQVGYVLDVSDLKAGVYIISIGNNRQSVQHKLLKE